MANKRWHDHFNSFSQALERLEEALENDNLNDLEKDGVIQRFEFTYELAWKTLQSYFSDEGYVAIKGPKKSIQQAFQNGLIANADVWSELLDDRNLMTHTYDKEASEKVYESIKNKYFQELCDLYHNLKKNQST